MGTAGHQTEDRGRAVGSVLLDHYLSCFNDGNHSVTLFEFQFVGTAACDGAFDDIVPDTNNYMSHDINQLDFFDFSTELISG